jgi:hypothetical protein
LAEVSDLIVRKFREVFTTGAVYVNYRAFLEAVRTINEEGVAPEAVKDTSSFRFDLRKGDAVPHLHRVPVPDASSSANDNGGNLDAKAVLQKIKKHVRGCSHALHPHSMPRICPPTCTPAHTLRRPCGG